MKINLVTIEDGLNNTGFRKICAYTRQVHPDTDVFYIVTGNQRSFTHLLLNRGGEAVPDEDVEAIAERIAGADIVAFSSMTQYSASVAAIIAAVRRYNPRAYVVWGGIHAIIVPEDAILHADAVCTGEGEFAFEALVTAFREGRPYYDTPSFWFRTPDGIKKNPNLPLMTNEEMDRLPIPLYQDGEFIFHSGRGFLPIRPEDYLASNGLTYKTVWSIGCPFKCTYCGNSKFIDYDRNYRKVRHSGPAAIVAEIKAAVAKHPHISTVVFDDDSFMALPPRVMEEFCRLFRQEIGLPFVITGLIPNYVREDKLRMLIGAGMNRVRMGIQSGSQAILDFYDRPTPVARIREACLVLNQYRRQMVPPAFDIILDNPIETIDDNRATLDLIYNMPRPFTLNIFSLRIIPNTRLATSFETKGISADDIRKPYTRPEATLSNILVFLMVTLPLPGFVFRFLRERSVPAHMTGTRYEALMMVVRFLYLSKRAADHLLMLDLSVLSGGVVLALWKLKLVQLWRKFMLPRFAANARTVETVEELGDRVYEM